MTHTSVWQRPWVLATESFLGHLAAIVIGFVMMVVGLVIGLVGAAIFVGGLFGHVTSQT